MDSPEPKVPEVTRFGTVLEWFRAKPEVLSDPAAVATQIHAVGGGNVDDEVHVVLSIMLGPNSISTLADEAQVGKILLAWHNTGGSIPKAFQRAIWEKPDIAKRILQALVNADLTAVAELTYIMSWTAEAGQTFQLLIPLLQSMNADSNAIILDTMARRDAKVAAQMLAPLGTFAADIMTSLAAINSTSASAVMIHLLEERMDEAIAVLQNMDPHNSEAILNAMAESTNPNYHHVIVIMLANMDTANPQMAAAIRAVIGDKL